ncbi:hypothetical protein RclHR1_08360001 [Rhizophagus clarus]|uniref:F-box domain-containing protein n=1 Tax=Rhizophagus clarus TaxID=94130 RepID=A0A2Z6SBP5_9GLOM|nr:hypothetical protein RclHR1_08360001 [Rhizophagus clarus]GET01470.1 hypothetical protein GLOIN_2v1876445 [Rhizophagus clarus]
MRQLNVDCLIEILRYLEGDKATLYSCLLVNRFWCKVSVRILWEEPDVSTKVLNTLISCLPDESKNILHNNGIVSSSLNLLCPPGDHLCKKKVTSVPTSKPPLFNYASYCKVLSIFRIYSIAKLILNNQQSINTEENINLITQEILKMFMSVSSLKKLSYTNYEDEDYNSHGNTKIPTNITFVHFPGTKHCLTYLSEFTCTSSVHPEVFNQLSKICYNIQSLNIKFNKHDDDMNGLKDLISSQNNLKSLSLAYYETNHWVDIIHSLKVHSDTLIKLSIKGEENHWPLSFIKDFGNLQELDISLIYDNEDEEFLNCKHFEDLQHFTFPHLRKLNINLPKIFKPIMVKLIENNGKNLEEFQSKCKYSSANLVVSKHCLKLKSLHTVFSIYCEGLPRISLILIFKNCNKLESIEILRRGADLSGKELLAVVAKNSPKNFRELKLHNYYEEIKPKDLESFFIMWKRRNPQKLLTLIFKDVCPKINNEKDKIIGKYEKDDIIKIIKM